MKRLLPILSVLLIALLGCLGEAMNVDVKAHEDIVVSSLSNAYSLTDPHQGRHNEATLNDARSIYHLCGPRSQRHLPTGSNGDKNPTRSLTTCRPYVQPFFFLHDGRRRLETAPFQSAASRDYYVFALRHILC